MNLWVAIVFMCALLGCAIGIAMVLVVRRRTPQSETASGVSLVKETIPSAGSDLWATDVDETGRDEGGVSLARQPTTGIPFESLIRRSAQDDRPRMDRHELVAVQQRMRISTDSEQPWRQTGRATVEASLDGSEVRTFDRAVVRRLAEDAFSGLVPRGIEVRAGLGGAAERVDLAWPQEAVLGYDGGVTGYFMPSLDASYVLGVPRRGRAVRMLEAANGINDADIRPLGDADVLDLVRTVAIWLRAMHAAGVVFGDLGQRSLAFATAPVRIRVLDYDTARVAGRCALLASDPEAEHDPLASIAETSYDSDRFLFAQLAFRLLVTRTPNGAIAPEDVPTQLLGLDERLTARLRRLWQRAAGPRGTRPTMDEWVDALGER